MAAYQEMASGRESCRRPRVHDPRGTEVTDLLGVIALLARTSAGLFLADMDPDLTLAEPGRTVTLVLPEGWRT